jgi:outer membrane receptor for ferrienterochelin and colicin
MNKILFLALCLLTLQAYGQDKRTISGYVSDEKTGEKLTGAILYDTVSKSAAGTNEYGFYSLTLPNKEAVLRVSFFGMDPVVLRVPVGENNLNIALYANKQLNEVVVIGTANREIENSNTGSITLQMDKVERLPIILGEKDIMRVVQLLPGVKTGGEASSGIYVRGGSPDQNLILLDGVPIYNASHLFGFFSTFNSDAISGMTLIKGGFPSRYGGRASSVLDIRMKEGNLKDFNVEGSVGVIASRLLVEGPIKKDKTSFAISARRTYLDLLYRPLMIAVAQVDAGYFFHDFNAKIQHKINDKHHLYLSGYFGLDRVFMKDQDSYSYDADGNKYAHSFGSRLQWGNKIGALRWNYKVNPRLFVNTTLIYSKYHFNVGMEDRTDISYIDGTKGLELYTFGLDSGIEDWGLKSDFTFVPNPNHSMRFGVSETYHTFTPGVNYLTVKNDVENQNIKTGSRMQYSHELSYYIEDDFKLGNKLKLNVGVHGSSFFTKKKSYHIPQPRFSANYRMTEKSSLKFGASRMAQYMHLLSNTGIGLPTDLWVPATDEVKPITANQLSLGYYRELSSSIVASVEGYYKKMNNLIQYKEGVSFISGADDWQNRVTTGQGWAYGAEFFIEKKQGDITGWVGYTLSWSERQFDELNFGRKFFHRYDQRHNLSVALTYQLDDEWDFGVVFVFGTGNAITLATQQYSAAPNQAFSNGWGWGSPMLSNFEQMNDYRMPAYHRLDVGANRTRKKKYGDSVLSFSVYNIYNRQNAFMLYDGYNKMGNKALFQMSLFPMIPSVSWKFKFDFHRIKMNKTAQNATN